MAEPITADALQEISGLELIISFMFHCFVEQTNSVSGSLVNEEGELLDFTFTLHKGKENDGN